MATLQEIRDAVDAKLAGLWSAIQNKQDAYFLANGRYWQGLRTHTIVPTEGNETLPSVGTTVPADQPDPWPVAIRNQTLPMALQIDVYDSPQGKGYQATVLVKVLGQLYRRVAQVGPETDRASGWQAVIHE